MRRLPKQIQNLMDQVIDDVFRNGKPTSLSFQIEASRILTETQFKRSLSAGLRKRIGEVHQASKSPYSAPRLGTKN